MKSIISIISPCYNEESNIEELYQRVCNVIDKLSAYDFEYIFVDNASTDDTVEILKKLAKQDPRIKVIVNNRNFGHIRSPYWGVLQTRGDATIYLASDLQDPPEMIPEFIAGWEQGYKVVMAAKPVSDENSIVNYLRRSYYKALDNISDVSITRDATGFGLYDRSVIDRIRKINDPYPYFRGLIDELGYSVLIIDFIQPRRLRGLTKNNFYSLYDMAMLGIVSHSKVPLRLASLLGFSLGLISIFVAVITFILKVFWWNRFAVGLMFAISLMCFMFSVIMILIGILGEYIGVIHTHVKNRPIVVERERINFD